MCHDNVRPSGRHQAAGRHRPFYSPHSFFDLGFIHYSWAQPLECDEDYPTGRKYTVEQSKAGTIVSFFLLFYSRHCYNFFITDQISEEIR